MAQVRSTAPWGGRALDKGARGEVLAAETCISAISADLMGAVSFSAVGRATAPSEPIIAASRVSAAA